MGEYINYHGKEVKLGTCEDLYYVRFNQLKENLFTFSKLAGNLSRSEYIDANNGFRYRFPFPDEDNIQIGEFEPYNRILPITLKYEHSELVLDMKHYTLWHSANINGGYNVNIELPCPYSKEFNAVKSSGVSWHIIGISQQKQVDCQLWTIIECPYCGTKSRIDYDGAIKLCDSILANHIDCKDTRDISDSKRLYYKTVIDRILDGYKVTATV